MQIFATAIVNQKRFCSSIQLTGMFYNLFISFECENILSAKDTGCFATFIQTAIGRQLTLNVKIHLTTGLEISARPLAQASVKTVGRVQITDHSPGLASTIIISRIYYYLKY